MTVSIKTNDNLSSIKQKIIKQIINDFVENLDITTKEVVGYNANEILVEINAKYDKKITFIKNNNELEKIAYQLLTENKVICELNIED